MLEQHDLNTGMIDIRDSDLSAKVEERYNLLLKAYGEHSEYVQGFRAYMQIVGDCEKEYWKGNTNYHHIKAMNVEELADFICDIYADNVHNGEIRVDGQWMLDIDVENWLLRERSEK